MTYTFDQDAFVELDAAVAFYERQREGLGLELFEAVERAADMLCEQPHAGEADRRWPDPALGARPLPVHHALQRPRR